MATFRKLNLPLHVQVLTVALGVSCLSAVATPAQTPAPQLHSPLTCRTGRCVIQQYFDHDAGPAARDHRCGAKAYNGHDGTDFRVPTRAAMLNGVSVHAVTAGVVRNVRDGVPDHAGTEADLRAAKGRECGNGVVLAHSGGWETQYCHLKRGSIAVSPGQRITAGVKLGEVGQSGEAAFPHLHLGVREGGREVDPFAYGAKPLSCGAGGRSLWSLTAAAELAYRAPEILNSGFAANRVSPEAVENAATGPAPTASSPMLVAWIRVIGLETGDVQTLSLTGPGGFTAENITSPLERPRAQQVLYTGRPLRAARWSSGDYRARYTVRRTGRVVLEHTFKLRM